MRTTFVIKRVFEKRLPAPYSNCLINVTGSEKLDALNKPYHQSECLDYCPYYLIAEQCQRLSKFLDFSWLFFSKYYVFHESFLSNIKGDCEEAVYEQAKANYRVMVFSTQKSKFYTKNIKNKKVWFSTQSNIIYFKKKSSMINKFTHQIKTVFSSKFNTSFTYY